MMRGLFVLVTLIGYAGFLAALLEGQSLRPWLVVGMVGAVGWCVSLAWDSLRPKRENSLKIEPRLDRPFRRQPETMPEIIPMSPPVLLPAPAPTVLFTPFPTNLGNGEIRFGIGETNRDTFARSFDNLADLTFPDPVEVVATDPTGDWARDLAARVTPEMLAQPIPTDVRELLMDLRLVADEEP